MGEIVQFPMNEGESETDYLWRQIEQAERIVENAKRRLGVLATELGIEDDEQPRESGQKGRLFLVVNQEDDTQ